MTAFAATISNLSHTLVRTTDIMPYCEFDSSSPVDRLSGGAPAVVVASSSPAQRSSTGVESFGTERGFEWQFMRLDTGRETRACKLLRQHLPRTTHFLWMAQFRLTYCLSQPFNNVYIQRLLRRSSSSFTRCLQFSVKNCRRRYRIRLLAGCPRYLNATGLKER